MPMLKTRGFDVLNLTEDNCPGKCAGVVAKALRECCAPAR